MHGGDQPPGYGTTTTFPTPPPAPQIKAVVSEDARQVGA